MPTEEIGETKVMTRVIWSPKSTIFSFASESYETNFKTKIAPLGSL